MDLSLLGAEGIGVVPNPAWVDRDDIKSYLPIRILEFRKISPGGTEYSRSLLVVD
jgi:hypothetical protein